MFRGWLLGLCLSFAGCSSPRPEADRSVLHAEAVQTRSQVALAEKSQIVVFEGACDASGAVPIDARSFAVADDEDNVFRIYDAERGGPPITAIDVSAELLVRTHQDVDAKGKKKKKKKKKKAKEADFEAATLLGDYALWLSSHGRTKKGKAKPERLRFVRTALPHPGKPLSSETQVYTGLLDDLLADARLLALGLAEAAEQPPQVEAGLNIEGMTAMPDGRVLLGFRNPVPRGRALLVALLDPLAPFRGERARFGEPVLLDLNGASVRGLSYFHGRYLIAAGSYREGGTSSLFAWRGPGEQPERLDLGLGDLNPEAFFTPEGRDTIMILSDDGSREIGGVRCKDLDDPRDKRFRGLWLRL